MDDNVIKDDPLLLKFEFELRMGFELFSLSLDGHTLNKRFSLRSIFSSDKKRQFFPNYLFSDNKKCLAIPEYTSDRLKNGSNFNLILFDLQNKKEANISNVNNGSIEPQKFEGSDPNQKVIYHKYEDGFTREFERKISSLKKWKKF